MENNIMTHALPLCNTLSLLIRYNEDEDVIEYRYSDEQEVKRASIIDNGEPGDPYFITDQGGIFSLEGFCKLKF